MHDSPEEYSDDDAAREGYREFSFFDGVMVDCSDMNSSWNSPSVFRDTLSIASPIILDASRYSKGRILKFDSHWDCISKEACQERPKSKACPNFKQRMPKDIASPERRQCITSFGTRLHDVDEHSIQCNFVTSMTSPGNLKNNELDRLSPGVVLPTKEMEIIEDGYEQYWSASEQSQANWQHIRTEASSSSSESYGHNGRASESEFSNKSALAAWAAVVSDSLGFYSKSHTGSSSETTSITSGKERVSTIAYHLELTDDALHQGKPHNGYGEDVGFAQQASSVIANTLKTQLAELKLDIGSLSIMEPAPYGTLHGVLHFTLKDGLPNHTLLLDDYNEVLTAKIWWEDMRFGKHRKVWKYSFYTLGEEKEKKGKSGWKNWKRKDKLQATFVGKMKVSSTLCSEENPKISVKSECILLTSRLGDLPIVEQGKVNIEGQICLSETGGANCRDANCKLRTLPGLAAAPGSMMSSHDSAWYISPADATTSWPSSSPTKPGAIDIGQIKKQINSDTQARLSNASSHRYSELAAMIMNLPAQMLPEDTQLTTTQQDSDGSITIILPSGNHGQPLCDSKGPSPLLRRWKEGGKCDCKGWDLGCGLMVLSNSRKKYQTCGNKEISKLQRLEVEDQSRPFRLYKQDTDQDEAFLSLSAQENGLFALDFRAPLSPLQAFAIAVAVLHGRHSNWPQTPHAVTLPETFGDEMHAKGNDRWLPVKASTKKSPRTTAQAADCYLQQTWQPQVAIKNNCINVHASSFERV